MRCEIPSKRIKGKQKSKYCVIKVREEKYNSIITLGNAAGRGIADVADRLLEFALEEAVVVNATQEDEYDD